MWTTAALVAALTLAPAQTGTLRLSNDRLTYGILGPPRTDSKFLPGDILCLTFDIEGLKTQTGGKIVYSLGLEVTDAKGKTQYKEDPRDLEAVLALGGNRVAAQPFVFIGVDQPAGEYTVKLTVADRVGKTTQTLTRKFQVVKADFGMVTFQIMTPNKQTPAPSVGVVGQEVLLTYNLVGFSRDKAKKPNVLVELTILDENKKPTLEKPITGTVQEVTENVFAVPIDFLLKLNRPGKFTLELKATDQTNKKTAALSIPIRILE